MSVVCQRAADPSESPPPPPTPGYGVIIVLASYTHYNKMEFFILLEGKRTIYIWILYLCKEVKTSWSFSLDIEGTECSWTEYSGTEYSIFHWDRIFRDRIFRAPYI